MVGVEKGTVTVKRSTAAQRGQGKGTSTNDEANRRPAVPGKNRGEGRRREKGKDLIRIKTPKAYFQNRSAFKTVTSFS